MPSMPPPTDQSIPALAAHARLREDPVTGKLLLLYPEGALELDDSGAEILRLCDGRRTLGEIVAALAGMFDAPPDEILRDTAGCLSQLSERGLIALRAP